MAQKSLNERKTNEELEELLDQLAKLLDRTKIMYEQYFMGIQKLPPQQLHRDIERRIRELTREHIRNTGLRYRLTNLKQKFGSYNSYWRRILREIERGTYIRDVARAGRKAARRGDDIAPEVLQAMPKRMRERILKDRDIARAKYERDQRNRGLATEDGEPRAPKGRKPGNVHHIEADADDLDLDALFDSITSEGPGTLGSDDSAPKAAPPAAQPRPSRADTEPSIPTMPDEPAPRPQVKPVVPPVGKVTPPPFGKVTPPRPMAGPPGKPMAPPPGPPPGRPPGKPPGPPPGPPPGQPPAARAKTAPPRRPAPPPPRPAVPRPAAKRSAPPPGMSDGQAKQLYDQYVKAKRLVGERTDNVSYDQLMKSLNRQAPGIMSKHKARGVEFGVVIKDEKVVLKAKPKK